MLFATVLLFGCDSDSGNPAGVTGSITVTHNLAKAKVLSLSAFTTTASFTGLDSNGVVRFGPVTLPSAPTHKLTQVPVAVQKLHVDYLGREERVLARADSPVTVIADGNTDLSIPLADIGLVVQVVNDSDAVGSDDDVYLLLTGAAMTVDGNITTLTLPQAAGGSIQGKPLSGLTKAGTWLSPYTGKTRQIYEFGVGLMTSGRLLVSFGTGLTYANNAAPTATSQPYRWDKMEFGYPNSGADLTAIDFFAIPMQIDYLDSKGNVTNTLGYYASTPTLLNALNNLDTVHMAAAFQGTTATYTGSPTAWNVDMPMSTFARVLGPQTIAASANASGVYSPSPYPSFAQYLDSLSTGGGTFTVTGTNGINGNPPTGYTYTGSFASDNGGGYVVTLVPASNMVVSPAPTYGPPLGMNNAKVTAVLPANLTVTVALPASQFDNYIYSATPAAFTVVGLPAADKQYAANSIYANIAGDFIAALHNGYIGSGSRYPNGAGWYVNPPTPFPFGAARIANDGFYNPYAAIFYNLSDAYGFPFSDRGGRPSPYVPMDASTAAMRITILPDNRLDAPQVTVASPSPACAAGQPCTLGLQWPAVAGATGYTVKVSYGGNPALPAIATQTTVATSYTVTGLNPDTAYTVSVTATGTNKGNAVNSSTVPVHGVTSGTAVASTPPKGSTAATFLTSLNWGLGTLPAGLTFTINGTTYVPGGSSQPVSVTGFVGNNVYDLTVKSNGTLIYKGNYGIALAAATNGYTLPNTGAFFLSDDPGALTIASGPVPANGYSSSPGSQLVIGTAFAPQATKLIAPVAVPSP